MKYCYKKSYSTVTVEKMKEHKASKLSELLTVPAKAIQIQIRVSHNYKNVLFIEY